MILLNIVMTEACVLLHWYMYTENVFAFLMQDFGSIFSTLLPGAKAKLVAPEGLSILDGLEFKVAFGDAWKESLGELSGGQR